ncbi:hypothetical protein [Idiomarina sp.]|uniref:hypothetical protein n=1 Tax=Idiomarina sp. TaxID=1874361 RepID=UPI002606EC0B|nr:hypothetical protein [Idiomarina sp.]
MSDSGGKLISAIVSILPKEAREYIGVWIMIFTPMMVIYGLYALQKLSEPSEECWKLQEVREVVYKVNACTGETIEMKSENDGAEKDT